LQPSLPRLTPRSTHPPSRRTIVRLHRRPPTSARPPIRAISLADQTIPTAVNASLQLTCRQVMLHDGLSRGLASKYRRVSRRDLSRASKWAGKQWALSPDEFLPSPTQAPFEAGSVKKPLSTSPEALTDSGNAGGTGETCVTACRPRATCHEGRASCRWPFIKGRRFGFPALPAN
jgi:hypothetical protein